jgi:hypothetical protein
MEALKIDATGVASSTEKFFSTQLGILSGPDALDILTLSKRRFNNVVFAGSYKGLFIKFGKRRHRMIH